MKVKTERKSDVELSLFKREILAIFFLAIGFFLYLSLLSYHPTDPSFLNVTSKTTLNLGGAFGSYLADGLIFLFGGGAYFVGLYFLFTAMLLFVGLTRQIRLHQIPVFLLCVVMISVVFQLARENLFYGNVKVEAGGFLGGILAGLGTTYLGRAGTYIVVIFGTMLTFVASTRVPLAQVLGWFLRGLSPAARWIQQQIVLTTARLKKGWVKWREARKVAQKEKAAALKLAPVLVPRVETKIEARPVPPPKLALVPETTQPKATPPRPEEPKVRERVDVKKTKPAQLEFQSMAGSYKLPPINLLDSENQQNVTVDEESLKMNARLLEKKLLDFEVEGAVTEIHPGPVITMYEFAPAAGVKLSRIANLSDDLCIAMGGRQVRIVAPLPDKPTVGIEIPNNQREMVWLKDIIADEKFQKNESKLVMALGKDIEGIPYVADLAKMPHLLVAGATGSGKSVAINSMILSILYKASPEEVRLIMVDPKMLELSIYEGIPHLLLPVVTEPKKAAMALRWAVREMERRYRLLSDINARNIANYNKKVEKGQVVSRQAEQMAAGVPVEGDILKHEQKLPYIVILIDELADLMMVSSREVEEAITRLAQMARAAGIHLILATQRPSVDVLTGVIKANFPARISFKVSSKHDARTVLDTIGSERLLGNGDMLYIPPGISRLLRVHGAFMSETEVGRVVDFLKQQAKPVYDETILKPVETEAGAGAEGGEGGEESDELYDQAVAIVTETRQASISMVQRKLRVGYNRAARMIERMEAEGVVSAPSGTGHRQVIAQTVAAN